MRSSWPCRGSRSPIFWACPVQAFLGEEGEAFLAFIHTLQNEDADVGTAVAREQDAPSEEYLAALVKKLTSLD